MADDAPRPNLLALRDARQRAESLLTTRYAEGLLDDDELDRRLERLYAADDLALIDTLVSDLGDATVHAALLPLARERALAKPASTTALARPDEIQAEREITAMFSRFEQSGQWQPARRTRVVGMFSETTIDLREALFGPGPTLIEVNCVCATLIVIVRPELAVRVEARMVFSSLERDPGLREQPLAPDDPQVIITGRVLFSSFELRERLVGESKRQAKRRRKALRKAEDRRKALPL